MDTCRRPKIPRLALLGAAAAIPLLLIGFPRRHAPTAGVGAAGPDSHAQAGEVRLHLPILLRSAARPWSPPLAWITTPTPPPATGAPGTPVRTSTSDPATPDPRTPDPSTPDPATPDPTTPDPATPFPSEFAAFGLIRLEPDMMLEGSGSVVDSIAFWEAPDPADSLMLVTAKGNQMVEVWQQPFADHELPALQHPSFGSGTQVNGILVDQLRDLLYVSTSRPASTVSVFSLPDLGYARQIVEGAVDLRSEPNLTLLQMPGASPRLYVSADNRVYIYDSESGQALGQFESAAPLETLLADDFQQRIYIPDEVGRTGIYAYLPDGEPFLQEGTSRFGGQDVFQADAEGITHYRCLDAAGLDDGRGWMIVADQRTGSSDFEFFDRQTWAHLGRLQLEGVSFTDGIASTQQALPRHPAGLFAALNNDRGVGLIGWDRILEATGLGCGVGGRQAGAMLQKADHAPAKEAQASEPTPAARPRYTIARSSRMDFKFDQAIAILERTPAILDTWLAGLPEAWTLRNDGGESWSPYDIVGHFVHGEKKDWITRAELILAEGGPHTFEPFDRLAQFRDSQGQSLEALLARFVELRAANLDRLRGFGLAPDDYDRIGRHPALGPVTLRQLLSTWVAHDLNHLAHIAEVMAAQYREQVGPWRAYLGILGGKD